jgi:prepilin-type N-terminal cleavage/methylation domain-containing protein
MSSVFVRAQRRGFSLIEVMAVVAIVGIISMLAYAGVSRYLAHSKTPEATTTLAAFENGSRVAFSAETDSGGSGTGPFVHQFCPTSAVPVPPAIPQAQRVMGVWNAATWSCLKFTMSAPQFYQYSYVSSGTGTGATYTATAFGDLNGNGVASTFLLIGKGGANGEAQRKSMVTVAEDE